MFREHLGSKPTKAEMKSVVESVSPSKVMCLRVTCFISSAEKFQSVIEVTKKMMWYSLFLTLLEHPRGVLTSPLRYWCKRNFRVHFQKSGHHVLLYRLKFYIPIWIPAVESMPFAAEGCILCASRDAFLFFLTIPHHHSWISQALQHISVNPAHSLVPPPSGSWHVKGKGSLLPGCRGVCKL